MRLRMAQLSYCFSFYSTGIKIKFMINDAFISSNFFILKEISRIYLLLWASSMMKPVLDTYLCFSVALKSWQNIIRFLY